MKFKNKVYSIFLTIVLAISFLPFLTIAADNTFCDPDNYVYENGLCIPKNEYSSSSLANSSSVMDLVTKVLKLLLSFAGIVVVIMIVYGGYLYMTAGGNDEQAEKGKGVLINSSIGLVVVLLAYTIVNIIVNLVTSGKMGF